MPTDKDTPRFPATKLEADKLDEEFMLELDRLTAEEHEKLLLEIYGFDSVSDDPPDVKLKLDELHNELGLIKEKGAFDLAMSINEAYVTNQEFLLMFLRRDKFDIAATARQIVWHFECKLGLFGDNEVLGRNVRISDLSGDALDALEKGCVQILPARDLGGRAISYVSAEWKQTASADSVACVMWYCYMVAAHDEESQRNGFVEVFYNFGNFNRGSSFIEQLHGSLSGLPVNFTGLHYCTNDENLMPYVAGARQLMDEDERVKFRAHVGKPQDVEFELQTVGIPTRGNPMQYDGSWSIELHREWLEMQRAREAQECDDIGTIVVPRRYDVLFGRSKNCREYIGNVHLVHLCSKRVEEYEAANRQQKTKIAEGLLFAIHNMRGRFLKWEWKGWIEVDDSAAREKISHLFRTMRRNATPHETGHQTKGTGKRTIACSEGEDDQFRISEVT